VTGVVNQQAILYPADMAGSVLAQTNHGQWCSQTETIEISGHPHQATWNMRHVKYTETNNTFSNVELGSNVITQVGHSYNHFVINPHNGDLYHRLAEAGTGNLHVVKKPLASRTAWQSTVPTGPEHWYQAIAAGACWWSGSFTGGQGTGAHGCMMVFDSGSADGGPTSGIVSAYDPIKNLWIYSQNGMAPNTTDTYHVVMEYSAVKNVAVYGGGNNYPRQLWRLNSDGTRVAMPLIPSGDIGIGVPTPAGRLVVDPVSGNFLVLTSGQLWELNPSGSGTWTQQTSTRVPPAGVGNPNISDTWIASVALPDHGCVGFIRCDSSGSNCVFWLYRHA
jgi:hypothetical protein